MNENSTIQKIESLKDAIQYIENTYLPDLFNQKASALKNDNTPKLKFIERAIEEAKRTVDNYRKDIEELEKDQDYKNKLKGH